MYHVTAKPTHRGLWTLLFVIAFVVAAVASFRWYNSPAQHDLSTHVRTLP